jgi:hypothetical protein
MSDTQQTKDIKQSGCLPRYESIPGNNIFTEMV